MHQHPLLPSLKTERETEEGKEVACSWLKDKIKMKKEGSELPDKDFTILEPQNPWINTS